MPLDTQALLLAGGAAACVLALVWRFLARHHQTSRLVRRLESGGEPEERARAGQALIDLGLRRAAHPVLQAMECEPDERVRLSVALAVARRQWEPTGPPRVASLRRWASEELEFQGHPVSAFGPAVTRLADMGGPRPPEGNRDLSAEDQAPAGDATEPTRGVAAGNPAEAPTVLVDPPRLDPPPLDPPHRASPTRPDPPDPGAGIRWVAPGSPPSTGS